MSQSLIAFAILDRSSRTLTWALAGHFSPLVLHADGTSSYLPEHPGPPLALTPHRRYVSSSVVLQLDDRIGSLTPGKEASFLVFDLERPHLRYQHDPISAIVHRASLADIEMIYVRGAPLQSWLAGE